jgi:hypothetical protein
VRQRSRAPLFHHLLHALLLRPLCCLLSHCFVLLLAFLLALRDLSFLLALLLQ